MLQHVSILFDCSYKKLTSHYITGAEKPNFWGIARRIWRTEGLSGYYRGFGANAFKTIPSSTIVWTVFEKSKEYYDKYIDY